MQKTKEILIGLICAMTFTQMYAQPQTYVERLKTIQKQGYMYGHQDDPFYGLSWNGELGRSDIKELVGEYPAVMGFDLGGIEMGDSRNLDSVPFSRIREEIITHYKRGGIVTISWHPRNPLTGGTAWDVTSNEVVKSILPGGKLHDKFVIWMERVSNFLGSLRLPNGTKIPIIFRPWHENNGSWFWWGQSLCTDTEYLTLWNMLQDYLNADGHDNLVWSYSPNLDGNFTEENYLKRYPGNDRVTIIGEDAYQWGTEADYVKQLNADLTFLSAFAKKNGKLFALTECGYKNIPDATWWTRVFQPIVEQYGLLYLLNWRNYHKEYFAPDKGQVSAADFKQYATSPKLLFLNDIQNIR